MLFVGHLTCSQDIEAAVSAAFTASQEPFIDPDWAILDTALGDAPSIAVQGGGSIPRSDLVWAMPADIAAPDPTETSSIASHHARRPSHASESYCLRDAEVSSHDIKQGSLGDCWLLSAAAVVAEKSGLIRRLFHRCSADQWRMNMSQIYLHIDGDWRVITIDNRLPAYHPSVRMIHRDSSFTMRRSSTKTLVYASSANGQYWVPLLEKAAAKAAASYARLEKGNVADGLRLLTGAYTLL